MTDIICIFGSLDPLLLTLAMSGAGVAYVVFYFLFKRYYIFEDDWPPV